MDEKLDYMGQLLFKAEVEVMVELEGIVHEPIPVVDEVESGTFGFVSRGNHVTQLGLYKRGLTALPETIGNLACLETLILCENKLKTVLMYPF